MTLAARRRLAVGVTQDIASAPSFAGVPLQPDQTMTSLSVRAVLGLETGAVMAGGPIVVLGDDPRVGGDVAVRARPWGPLGLLVRGETRTPWRESASTIREDGQLDALTADLHATPLGDRLAFRLTGQVRRLGLVPMASDLDSHATQWFGAAGADLVLAVDPGSPAHGEFFDHDLLWPVGHIPALVLTYRHYELSSEDPFGARLVLIERSRIDEVGGSAREVVFGGALTGELRAGIGNDSMRDVRLWRAGASLQLSATDWTRLSLDWDVASEGATIAGRRHTGLLGLHVDI